MTYCLLFYNYLFSPLDMHILWYVIWISPSCESEPYPMTNCKRRKIIQKKIIISNSHPPYNMEFTCKIFLITYQMGKKKKKGRKQTIWNNFGLENLSHMFQMPFSSSASTSPSECIPNYYLLSVMGSANSLG